jgi:hypothetical protein
MTNTTKTTKTPKVKEKTKFTSKDVKFEVGDVIYGLYEDNGSDYSIRQLFIEQFKIASIELKNDRIHYQTTTECEITDTLINEGTKIFFKTKEAALKAFQTKALIHFDEKLTD